MARARRSFWTMGSSLTAALRQRASRRNATNESDGVPVPVCCFNGPISLFVVTKIGCNRKILSTPDDATSRGRRTSRECFVENNRCIKRTNCVRGAQGVAHNGEAPTETSVCSASDDASKRRHVVKELLVDHLVDGAGPRRSAAAPLSTIRLYRVRSPSPITCRAFIGQTGASKHAGSATRHQSSQPQRQELSIDRR